MKQLILLPLLIHAFFLQVQAQPASRVDVYFENDTVLKFQLDAGMFGISDTGTVKSTSSDFTATGYHIWAGDYDELVLKARKHVVRAFNTSDKVVFDRRIAPPYPEGVIIFGTNGYTVSSIYVFKANYGYGWVIMNFKHDRIELDKVNTIVASIAQD